MNVKRPIGSTLLLLILFFSACQKPEVRVETGKITETALKPVESPQYDQAIVSFLSGDVQLMFEEEWNTAEIGDLLRRDHVLRVDADSFCEMQFGERTTVRIQENTEVLLETLFVKPDEMNIGLKLSGGSLIAKVGDLSAGERFSIKTSTTTCGVRGTEFLVREGSDQQTVLAVKEGSVSVLPASVDMDKLRKMAGDHRSEVLAAIGRIEESAPVVEAGHEITVRQEVIRETEEKIRIVETAVEKIVEEQEKSESPPSDETMAGLTMEIEAVIQEISTSVGEPEEISEESSEDLEKVEEMRIVSLPAANQESERTAPIKISLKIDPGDAEIYRNGTMMGRGVLSGLYDHGEELSFVVRRSGYTERRIDIEVEKDTDREYRIVLEPKPETSGTLPEQSDREEGSESTGEERSVEEETPEAVSGSEQTASSVVVPTVIVDIGPPKPSLSAALSVSDEETPSPTEAGPEDTEQDESDPEVVSAVVLPAESEVPTKSPEVISFQVEPADAEIRLNGSSVGMGSYSGEHSVGERLEFVFEQEDYRPETLKLTVGEGSGRQYDIVLEALPFSGRYSVSHSRMIGMIRGREGIFLGVDSFGVISSSTKNGRVLWTLPTENSPNEFSYPVLSGDNFYLSGSRELVIGSIESGRILGKIALDRESAHLFGRRIVPYRDSIVFPANDALRFLDPKSGRIQSEIVIPDGSRMSPAVYGDRLVIVNQMGVFLVIDPDTRTIESALPTSAHQPVATEVKIHGDRGFFAGRRGTLVCVDLAGRRVLWEKQLSDKGEVNIYRDLVVGDGGVYAYSQEGRLYALSMTDGSSLFEPVEAFVSPPLYRKERLYCSTKEGDFNVMSAKTGVVLKSLAVGGRISTAPEWTDGKIVVGTDSGEILIINPEADWD